MRRINQKQIPPVFKLRLNFGRELGVLFFEIFIEIGSHVAYSLSK